MSVKEKVVFNLIGGVGNQLFILVAARYLKQELKYDYELLAPPKRSKSGHKDSTIASLIGTDDFIRYRKKKLSIKNKVLSQLKIGTTEINDESKRFSYQPKNGEIGFDKDLLLVKEGTFIDGFFQTWRYFTNLKNSKEQEFKLKKPSRWYLEMKSRIEVEKPIVMHVRRGDYEASGLGVLSNDYYKESIIMLSNYMRVEQIWIFSDEPQKAREELELLNLGKISYIIPPKGSSAVESLLLMAEAEAIVIANSTFSWWSATLSKKGTMVICPDKWFQNAQDPRDLIPPHWTRIPSLWK